MFYDMKEKYPAQNLKTVFMTKFYNSWEVMAGHWRYSEPIVARKVEDTASNLKMQSLW